MRFSRLTLVLITLAVSACGTDGRARATAWTGTTDTLASGQIVARNTAEPLWARGAEWGVVEEVRIGTLEGDGPDLFGRINSIAVDGGGRIWVLEAQAQELRVFAPDGQYLRTIGRRGGGPGEFNQAVRIDEGPDGNLWVMDPQNNRLSVIDTAGVFVESKWASGGFVMMPWPGGFDTGGRYYSPVGRRTNGPFSVALLRYDPDFQRADTLDIPQDPVEREYFEHERRSGGERVALTRASVPFQGGLLWRISPSGSFWALVTDQYRLFEIAENGDTLRTITKAFEPVPVTAEEREKVPEQLGWFTDQGGRIDLSKVPNMKPATAGFFLDDAGHVWVIPISGLVDQSGGVTAFDVFDPDGRFLGTVRLPFALGFFPQPLFRDGYLYGVVQDELEVPYVVKARVERPS